MQGLHRTAAIRHLEEPLWGLDSAGRHDRYWFAHGVEVVRRGRARRGRASRGLFMLLGEHDLLLGTLPDAAPRLRRRGSAALLVTIESDSDEMDERVRADARGRLVRIERRYGRSRPRARRRVLLTGDAALADAWARRATSSGGADLVGSARRDGWRRVTMRGRLFDARDETLNDAFTMRLLRCWQDPMAAVPGVRPVRPGVWAHETARIGPGARLVGPVWLGAGVVVRPNEVVVGPRVLPDVMPTAAPTDWDRLPPLRLPREPSHPGGLQASLRRGFDIAFAIAALAVTALLYPFIMLAIWREDGRPFFFSHTRQTRGGRPFTCYKFRTMCRDAETMRERLVRWNLADGPQFHIPDDPRLLRTGRWLRRFHLDELPQFWNVLRGQMSVVGPRPSPDDENQCCPAWREMRLSVRPGVTGLWQVRRTRRPNADFQEWIRYDLEYVRRRSWRLDLWIIVQTLGKVIVR